MGCVCHLRPSVIHPKYEIFLCTLTPDGRFPINLSKFEVEKDHTFLEQADLDSLIRRLNILNRCADVMESIRNKVHQWIGGGYEKTGNLGVSEGLMTGCVELHMIEVPESQDHDPRVCVYYRYYPYCMERNLVTVYKSHFVCAGFLCQSA